MSPHSGRPFFDQDVDEPELQDIEEAGVSPRSSEARRRQAGGGQPDDGEGRRPARTGQGLSDFYGGEPRRRQTGAADQRYGGDAGMRDGGQRYGAGAGMRDGGQRYRGDAGRRLGGDVNGGRPGRQSGPGGRRGPGAETPAGWGAGRSGFAAPGEDDLSGATGVGNLEAALARLGRSPSPEAAPLARGAGHARRSPRKRKVLRAVMALVAVIALLLAVSVIGAATSPGNVNFKAKWADWLRAHHAAFVVNPMEKWYYSQQAPPKGGAPKGLNAVPKPAAAKGTSASHAPAHLPPPAPVPLVVSPALPGEGQWQPTGPLVDGKPRMYVAEYRADNVYTSQLTSAVWIDPTALRVRLVPGAQEPGGTWPEPPDLTGTAAANAVAAFNGGFRFQDAHGGFYLDGRAAVPLRTGAASAVIYKDGRVNIGAWGSEVSMTPQVAAVLQNLVPLVDNGQIAPDATYNDTKIWGNTLGASTVVARSGLGVTADGALVYVAGPALTAKTLAESLARAGAVRAMTLDINPEWVTFNFFSHPNPADPAQTVGTKLYPRMQRPSGRYLGPQPESRDFFTVSTS